MSYRKENIEKDKKAVFSKDIVQNNPIFTVQEIQKFFYLFNLYADERRQANISEMVSTAKTLKFDEKFSVVYHAMVRIAQQYDGKWIRFQTFLTDLTQGNPQTEDGRRAMFELADLQGKQILSSHELMKVSDGLGFGLTYQDIQNIIKAVSGPKSKGITWDQFNDHVSKRKVQKK